jgi:hypothetical protein
MFLHQARSRVKHISALRQGGTGGGPIHPGKSPDKALRSTIKAQRSKIQGNFKSQPPICGGVRIGPVALAVTMQLARVERATCPFSAATYRRVWAAQDTHWMVSLVHLRLSGW